METRNRFEQLKLGIAARLIRAIVRGLCATCSVEIVAGEQRVEALIAGDPVILTFWHDRMAFMAYWIESALVRRGFRITVLTSHSRDGELGAKFGRLFGAHIVRGSTSRGGSAGLLALYRALTRDGSSPIVIPDGPRGPAFVAKSGAIVLAQMSGALLQPLAYSAERHWKLRSWDRLILPRPFSRIRLALGEPQAVARGSGEEELEQARGALETSLRALVRQTENPGDSSR